MRAVRSLVVAIIPTHTACVALTPPSSFAGDPATLTFTRTRQYPPSAGHALHRGQYCDFRYAALRRNA